MTLEDGTVLDEPSAYRHHDYTWDWARSGGAEVTVYENEYNGGTLLRITLGVKDRSDSPSIAEAWVGADFLGRVMALRIKEGWKLISADKSSATLVRSWA